MRPSLRRSPRPCAARAPSSSASGWCPDAVGKPLASPIHTPGVSCSSPQPFATLVAGSLPIRAEPMWCRLNVAWSYGSSEASRTRATKSSIDSPESRVHGSIWRWNVAMPFAPPASCRRTSSSSAVREDAPVELVVERVLVHRVAGRRRCSRGRARGRGSAGRTRRSPGSAAMIALCASPPCHGNAAPLTPGEACEVSIR